MHDLTNVTTGEVRLSYVHLFKPFAHAPGQEEKFSCTILVPKSDVATKARIDQAIEEAKRRGAAGNWQGVIPPIVAIPVYDGDGTRPSDGMPFGEECKGHWVFTASAKIDYQPEVVDAHMNPIINQSEIYSGIYAKVNVNFFPYNFNGKKGVGCGLGPVMKTRDGESLGGSSMSAAQAFGGGTIPLTVATPQYGVAQPATPQYGVAQPPTPQYAGSYPVQPGQINPITGLPV